MPEPAAADDAVGWRTIDELAALVGAYCWLEHRIFEVTGAWATAPGAGGRGRRRAAGVVGGGVAAPRRPGRTLGRTPARAGRVSSRQPSSAAPDGPQGLAEALDELAATKELAVGVAALVETVLPWVGGVYGSHLAVASPVSEASVMEVLVEARREGSAEIRGGQSLLGRLPEAGKPSRHLGKTFKRAFATKRRFPCCSAGLTAPLH